MNNLQLTTDNSQQKKRQKGFSLLELLIYVAVFGAIVLGFSSFLVAMVGGRDSENVRFEVLQNLRFSSEKIRQLVYDADNFATVGACPLNSLEAFSGGTTTTVSVIDGVLTVSSGAQSEAVTSAKVTATTTVDCLFKKIVNPSPSKPTLLLRLKISYNDNGNPKYIFSDELRTTVSQR